METRGFRWPRTAHATQGSYLGRRRFAAWLSVSPLPHGPLPDLALRRQERLLGSPCGPAGAPAARCSTPRLPARLCGASRVLREACEVFYTLPSHTPLQGISRPTRGLRGVRHPAGCTCTARHGTARRARLGTARRGRLGPNGGLGRRAPRSLPRRSPACTSRCTRANMHLGARSSTRRARPRLAGARAHFRQKPPHVRVEGDGRLHLVQWTPQ